jgi:hypothetical protein
MRQRPNSFQGLASSTARPAPDDQPTAGELGESENRHDVRTIPLWPKRVGCEAAAGAGPTEAGSLGGPALAVPFLLAVPDYIQADWLAARPRPRPGDGAGRPKRGRQHIGGGLHWAIHQAVLVQRTSRPILADVVLAQALWGGGRGGWPRNWRQRLVQRLKRATALDAGLSKVVHREADRGERACPAGCALHGTRVRHRHLEITISAPAEKPAAVGGDEPADPDSFGTFLGALEVFGYDDYPDRAYHWTPRPLPPEPAEDEEAGDREAHKRLLAKVKVLKRTGRLAAVYFPLKLFGSSPRVGLSWRQRQLHQAITRELTRGQAKARPGRPDRAEIVIGGRAPDGGAPGGVAPCPYLGDRGRYVGFNGNGSGRKRRLHGRGYRPLVWMRKAAYEIPEGSNARWRQVRLFLRDLGRLGESFGLVV